MASFRVLREGVEGEDVAQWQSFLIGQGFDPGPADGLFSADTARATREFQEQHGLAADGIAGRITLGSALTLGLAADDDDDLSENGPHWPSPPNFAPLASNAERERVFGRFAYVHAPVPGNPEHIRITDDWAAKNIVKVELPLVGKVRFHRYASEQLVALWNAWDEAKLLDRVLRFDGSFVPRFVRGSRTKLSNHAFGSAFDINARWNALGAVPALLGRRGCVRELVEIAYAHGFYWGGHFSRPDGMHFEVAEARGAPQPPRAPGRTPFESAPSELGTSFIQRTRKMSETERERAIAEALLAGNDLPSLRAFVPVTVKRVIDGAERTAVYRVAPDYLSIGTDEDFVRIPMYPATAQKVADAWYCVLPTRRMVEDIYHSAALKLAPRPMPDGRRGSNDYYLRHQQLVEEKRQGNPLGALTAGHKKDIVITPKLRAHRDRVAIYGWHELDGDPIQPLSLVHSAHYVDYSHGVRLVAREVTVDGEPKDITEVLRDPKLSALLSDEGPVSTARYVA